MQVSAKSIKLIDSYAIHIFSRKQTISWKGYDMSIDPETFYDDANEGYPENISAAKLIAALNKVVK